ncbi:hypothetical protein CORC01_06735 [Colletotrichum orchidophilum]|uniref:Uncharacterized protein n=1 Tax=Colletotrichum orchidophilum TaxID=1209926 RepID=A0A1G4B9B7_9PEZI|nr:uncharacterized protein CORC01_06735 [Colletotrichum orchidophilum]OHE97872.1 hypothetical protein CORC01_06735 [Colletotrichum orchidophilum]
MRTCQDRKQRSTLSMTMLCPVIDWVVDSLGKVLFRSVIFGGSSFPSFYKTRMRRRTATWVRAVLESRTCVYMSCSRADF